MGLTQITTGGVDDNINIDSNTLKVDGTNNRVGIGEASPSATLHAKSGTTDVVADFESTDANAWIQIRDNSTTDTAVMVGAVGDDMRLRAGSNERVRIDSSGNVGINETSPSAKLHISAAYNETGLKVLGGGAGYSSPLIVGAASGTEYMRVDDDGRLLLGTTTEGKSGADEFTVATSSNTGITIRSGTSSTGDIMFSDGTSGDDEFRGIVRYDHSNNSMQLWSNASERMRIDSSGRLLLGLTSTSQIHTLQVQASSGANAVSVVGRSVDDQSEITFYENDNSTILGQIQQLSTHSTYRHRAGYLRFDSGGFNEKMRIASNGNVGIGTSSPGQLLEINGASNPCVLIKDTTNNVIAYTFADDSVANFGSASNHPVVFRVNNNERMRIDSSGRVGIGTSSPGNPLHIAHQNPSIRLQSNSGSYMGRNTLGQYNNILYLECDNDNAVANSAMAFTIDATERMRITSTGQLQSHSEGNTTMKPMQGCRAFCCFKGTGTVSVHSSFNVASLTDLGTGFYEISFGVGMIDANYGVTTGFQRNAANDEFVNVGFDNTTARFRTEFFDSGTRTDCQKMTVAVFR